MRSGVVALAALLFAVVCGGASAGAGSVIEQNDYGPVYSPDGSHIAFRRIVTGFYGGAATPLAAVMTAHGGDVRELGPMSSLGAGEDSLTWTPDSQALVYGTLDGVTLAGADGSGPRVVGPGNLDTSTAPVSREGWVVFTTTSAPNAVATIGEMRLDGTGRHTILAGDDPRLTDGAPDRFWSATFSPDGTRIAFIRGDTVWTVDRSGASLSRVDVGTHPANYGAALVWSPDGSRLLYRASDGIHVVDPSGARLLVPTGNQIDFGAPAWSPDGRRVVVPTTTGYALIAPDGSLLQRLDVRAPLADGGRYASWSPDGDSIALDETIPGCRTSSISLAPATLAARAVVTGDCRIVGTSGADTIRGTDLSELIEGRGGNDRIYGGQGWDTIDGGAGSDVLHSDQRGGTLAGGPGNDVLVAQAGDDLLVGGPGRDRIDAGAGQDRVLARDGARDVVDCGPGVDRATVDRVDAVRHCETVLPSGLRRRGHR